MPTTVPDSVYELPADFDWDPQAVCNYINDSWEGARDTDAVGTLFDLAAGLYWYCSDWHSGMHSPEYSILSAQLDYCPGCCEESPIDEEGKPTNAEDGESVLWVYLELRGANQ